MADLRTRYLGLDLRTPLVASSSTASRAAAGSAMPPGSDRPGPDALELNVYYVSSSPGQSGSEVEWRYLDKVLASHRSRG